MPNQVALFVAATFFGQLVRLSDAFTTMTRVETNHTAFKNLTDNFGPEFSEEDKRRISDTIVLLSGVELDECCIKAGYEDEITRFPNRYPTQIGKEIALRLWQSRCYYSEYTQLRSHAAQLCKYDKEWTNISLSSILITNDEVMEHSKANIRARLESIERNLTRLNTSVNGNGNVSNDKTPIDNGTVRAKLTDIQEHLRNISFFIKKFEQKYKHALVVSEENLNPQIQVHGAHKGVKNKTLTIPNLRKYDRWMYKNVSKNYFGYHDLSIEDRMAVHWRDMEMCSLEHFEMYVEHLLTVDRKLANMSATDNVSGNQTSDSAVTDMKADNNWLRYRSQLVDQQLIDNGQLDKQSLANAKKNVQESLSDVKEIIQTFPFQQLKKPTVVDRPTDTANETAKHIWTLQNLLRHLRELNEDIKIQDKEQKALSTANPDNEVNAAADNKTSGIIAIGILLALLATVFMVGLVFACRNRYVLIGGGIGNCFCQRSSESNDNDDAAMVQYVKMNGDNHVSVPENPAAPKLDQNPRIQVDSTFLIMPANGNANR